MQFLNKQEYLDFINKLLDQQYNDDEPEVKEEDSHWMPAESPLKDKIPIGVLSGTMDLTDARKEKINTALANASNFKVDHFLVKVKRNQLNPKTNSLTLNPTLDIELYEERFKTPSGNPCRMTYRLDIGKDSRFTQCKWANYFGAGSTARNVPKEVFIDIIRWMQALKRLTAFL